MFRTAIVLGAMAMAAPGAGGVIYEFDFATDLKAAGWTHVPPAGTAGQQVWVESEGFFPDKGGKWTSPRIPADPADPFRFYRLEFESKAEAKGYYAVFFQDRQGNELVADIYGSIHPGQDWTPSQVCFRGREQAVTFTVSFIGGARIEVRNLKVATVTTAEVCAWADRLYATLPPLAFTPDPGRWKLLPRTIRRLQDGGTLRIVMLGDSIVNDTNNSSFDALVMRQYPQARLNVVCSVRGSTGCWHYQDDARFQAYVADLKPELLMIGGISHRQDLEAIRQVVRKAKARCRCEVLLMSGPVGVDWRPWDEQAPDRPLARTACPGDEFNGRLRQLAAEEQIEFLDLNGPWHEYLAASGMPHDWFHRDYVHANDRGKQILARILERYFAPKPQPPPPARG